MNTRRHCCLVILALLLASFSQAQALQVQHDSVIVRDNRMQLPAQMQNNNITILSHEQIKQLPVRSTYELLAYVSGVDIRQRGPWGTQADVSINGSTFDQVLVLINGVKISDPQTGHNMMNLSLPIGSIDHIEVLRGPAARVYGVNALAGAINIVTVQPKENQVAAQVYTSSSMDKDTSNGDTYYSWGAQGTASLVNGEQSHTIGLAHDEGTGYRYNTGYNSNKVFYQNHTQLNANNAINAFGVYSKNSFGANGYYSSPGDKESKETVESVLGSVAYTYQHNYKFTITPRVSYRYNKDDYIYIRQKPAVYHNIHETNTITGEVQSTVATRNGKIGLGAEWRNEQINSTNLGKRERYNAGLFAEYRHNFSEQLNASAGLYANYNSDYDWQVFPSVDAGFKINDEWKLFANFTTGQRLPTYTDLYYKGPLNIGNDQLKPEQSTYGEGGVQYRNQYITWKGSYFYRHVSDLIDWVRASDSLPWQPQNFQVLNTSGWTAQVILPVSKYLALAEKHNMNLDLSYTYLNQEIATTTEMKSKYSIEALRHQMVARLNTNWFHNLDVNAAARYLQRINYNDYTILDLRIAYRIKNWQVFADANNLLDTQYKEIGTVLMPGRWMTVGVRWQM